MSFTRLYNLIFKEDIITEVLIANKGKFPDNISVSIAPSQDGGYIVNINELPGCITQAENGKEIFEMVNDALYAYFEVPKDYQPFMPVFFPPENERKQFNIEIPNQYLNKNLVFQRT
ncbi:type II toxin-antitoxin system HicB family antitoxin [Patescibacteria group bacterium]|nr:type II toxin-antitoxin system HicB family antitoxin [Patescibacteria group bacterium]MBU4141382.1 type II toxin-antitoxin system HicB family antitoxin [Patescibacteria group bacterium]MBU4338668.1 type II toxin-antitoxin system HicB family antitoxin [Patescibacteria group bacterium]MBU4580104.1 type II toxin-antitoxin system HicB family antitoxin [Patescibacteria group bacterium]